MYLPIAANPRWAAGQALITRGARWLRQALHSPCRLCGKYGGGQELCGGCADQVARQPWGMSSLTLDAWRIPVLWRESYGGPLTDIIVRAKYFGDWGAARFLGDTLGRLPRPWMGPAPLILPIPLASARLANRGFNQSRFIAQSAAQAWHAPIKIRWLRKTKTSARQASLHRQARQENLAGVFSASSRLRGQRVVLIDDIMTSGATLREAAHAVTNSGGLVIGAAVIARVNHSTGRLPSTITSTPYVQRRTV